MRKPVSLLAVAATFALAACGGGGGGSASSPVVPAGPPPTAFARGTVVDLASAAPLAGVTVSLAPNNRGAAPVATTTTAADGTFSVGAATAGTYMLVIGSDLPNDSRTTFHQMVTLATGTNQLSAPRPSPEPDVTYTPAQTSGSFRLATLSSNESNCVNGTNLGRANSGLRALIPDELLLEEAHAINMEEFAQDSDTPSPLYQVSNGVGGTAVSIFGGTSAVHSSEDFLTCDAWTGPAYAYKSGNPPYNDSISTAHVWFSAAFAYKGSTNISHTSYGAAAWGDDPRP